MKFKLFLSVCLLATISSTLACGQGPSASITTPDMQCFVTEQIATISGTSIGNVKEIYPIVHSTSSARWWVQPAVTIASDGSWTGPIYLGEPGRHYTDYLVQIVVDPSPKIKPGEYGDRAPNGRYLSRAITVKKRGQQRDCQ